jgi:surface antigen
MPIRKTIAVIFLASAALGPATAWAFNTSFLRDAPLAYFTDKDWSLFKDTLDRALNGGGDGATSRWDNPSSGSSGEVTPLDTRQVDGMTCRNTRIVTSAQGLTARGEYQLCKAADGEWTLGGPTN